MPLLTSSLQPYKKVLPKDIVSLTIYLLIQGHSLGTGHGAWVPKGKDEHPYLQVDFPSEMEVKGIITQVTCNNKN